MSEFSERLDAIEARVNAANHYRFAVRQDVLTPRGVGTVVKRWESPSLGTVSYMVAVGGFTVALDEGDLRDGRNNEVPS